MMIKTCLIDKTTSEIESLFLLYNVSIKFITSNKNDW